VLADDKANVTGLQSQTDKKSMQTTMDISLEIADLPTLSDVIGRLERLPNVISVKRKS
jgi:GTP pyrophosphokinase